MRPPSNHAESKLQMLEQQIYDFNHTFWKEHNIEFQQAKSDYINKLLSTTNLTRNELTSNHLMEFHRSFLNGKYQTHKQYL
uniref:Uncharacterized protein n=1 Tax=Amphimedon queenslandica TaxID=400682 RepID=A0A1X7SW00_AMPQE